MIGPVSKADGDNEYCVSWDTLIECWLPQAQQIMFTEVPTGTYEIKLRGGTLGAGVPVRLLLAFQGGTANVAMGRLATDAGYDEYTLYVTTTAVGDVTLSAGATSTIMGATASIRQM